MPVKMRNRTPNKTTLGYTSIGQRACARSGLSALNAGVGAVEKDALSTFHNTGDSSWSAGSATAKRGEDASRGAGAEASSNEGAQHEDEDEGNLSQDRSMNVDVPQNSKPSILVDEGQNGSQGSQEEDVLDTSMVPMADMLNAKFQSENVRSCGIK